METLARAVLHQMGIYNLRENLDLKTKQFFGNPYYWTSYPMAVQIDTTNRCGPEYSGVFCSYCFPQGEVLAKRDCHANMPMEWIEWIQKDMAKNMPRLLDGTWPPKQQVCYFLNGDWQNEYRSEDILNNHFKVLGWLPSQVFTCASKPEQAWRFCNSKLNWVCVTCSAPNSEIYKIVHGGNQFENVIKTMKYIDEHADKTQKLEVHYVITKDNIEGMNDWYTFMGDLFPRWNRVFSPLVKSECNQRSVNSMGNLTLEQQETAIININPNAKFWSHQTTALKQACVLHNNAAITCHGEILQCCNWDKAGKWNYGYIQDYIDEGRSLKDYWMERLANKQRNSLCRACNLRHPDYKHRLNNTVFNVRVKA
jgi:hypothetical protein